jgi:hypothetical protein
MSPARSACLLVFDLAYFALFDPVYFVTLPQRVNEIIIVVVLIEMDLLIMLINVSTLAIPLDIHLKFLLFKEELSLLNIL